MSYTSQEYRVIQAKNTELYKPRIQSYTSQEYRVIQAKNTELQVKNTELYKPRMQSYNRLPRIQSYTSQEYRAITVSQEYRAYLHSNVVTDVVPDVDKQGKHREGHLMAAEGNLTPHNDEGEEGKEDGTDSVHPGPEPQLPVPL